MPRHGVLFGYGEAETTIWLVAPLLPLPSCGTGIPACQCRTIIQAVERRRHHLRALTARDGCPTRTTPDGAEGAVSPLLTQEHPGLIRCAEAKTTIWLVALLLPLPSCGTGIPACQCRTIIQTAKRRRHHLRALTARNGCPTRTTPDGAEVAASLVLKQEHPDLIGYAEAWSTIRLR